MVFWFDSSNCACAVPYFGYRQASFAWSVLAFANNKGSGETALMRSLARAFAGRLSDKYPFLMGCLIYVRLQVVPKFTRLMTLINLGFFLWFCFTENFYNSTTEGNDCVTTLFKYKKETTISLKWYLKQTKETFSYNANIGTSVISTSRMYARVQEKYLQ